MRSTASSSKQLDPAFAALLRDLARRQLLDRTVVLCCGEFGRTPKINPLEAATTGPPASAWPWPAAACVAVWPSARPTPKAPKTPSRPTTVDDVHATVLKALGIDPVKENIAPLTGRPIKLSGESRSANSWAEDFVAHRES